MLQPGLANVDRNVRFLRLIPLLVVLPAAARAQPVQVIHAFDTPPRSPLGGLVQAGDGSLYGTTSFGGARGTIYRIDPAGQVSVVHRFTSGRYPSEGLITGNDGALYGTTRSGGSGGAGTVFRFDPATRMLRTLHAFTGLTGGSSPAGPLMQASDGMLYGVTESGGAGGGGTIFRVNPATGATVTLHAFESFGAGGERPVAGLTEAPNGFLYGTTRQAASIYGLVYRLDRATGGVTTVHEFNRTTGWDPTSTLTRSADGFLYGTTLRGGADDAGTIYRLNPATGALQFVYELRPSNGTDGGAPYTRLVEASDGHLYGTTRSSGSTQIGTIFRLVRLVGGGFSCATLRVFDPPSTGSGGLADLTLTTDGFLYGATEHGGPGTGGTVFRFDPLGRGQPSDPLSFSVVHAFTVLGAGWEPSALVQAPDGLLYGTTRAGGAHGRGEVYRVDRTTGVVTSLGSLPGPPLPAYEYASNSPLVPGGDGYLYGTSSRGNAAPGDDRIIRVDPLNGTVTTALTLPTSGGGSSSLPGLMRTPDGRLYGTQRGSSFRLFRFDPTTSAATTVATPTVGTGLTLSEGMAGSDGWLYFSRSDIVQMGHRLFRYTATVFRIDPNTGSQENVTGFEATAIGSPVQAASGRLYVTIQVEPGLQLVAIDPVARTSEVVYSLPGWLIGINGLSVAPDGSLYGILVERSTSTLVRFDPIDTCAHAPPYVRRRRGPAGHADARGRWRALRRGIRWADGRRDDLPRLHDRHCARARHG